MRKRFLDSLRAQFSPGEVPETHQPLGEKTEEELLEDIVRDLDKLGVLPMIAARYQQSCLTVGPQSDERRQLPGRNGEST
jgi:hypothetical protein